MEFILFVLIVVLGFLVFFLYARLNDEIKNVKGKGIVEEVKKEIEGLIVEFNKVSNRKIIVMDEKIKEIENLIKLADEKILKLDALTRNYAELVKRYEIAKKDFQDTLNITYSKGASKPRVLGEGVGDSKELNIKPIENKVKMKAEPRVEEEIQRTLVYTDEVKMQKSTSSVNNTSEVMKGSANLKDKLEIIREEVGRMDIESMDFDARAELLRKLLSYGFEDYELIKLGFTESEIRIAKVLISNES